MNNLEKHVLRLIGENVTTPDVFADSTSGLTQIRGSITDAIEELCMLTGCYRRPYQLTLVSGRVMYRLRPEHDYVIYCHSVYDGDRAYRLERAAIWELKHIAGDWINRTGPATYFAHAGLDAIAICYQPDTTGQVLQIDAVCAPKPYADSTSPILLRNNYEQAVVYFAVGEFYASRGDTDRAASFWKKYQEITGLMTMTPEYADRMTQLAQYKNSWRYQQK